MQRFEDKFDLLEKAYKDEKLKKGTIALLQYLVHKSNKTHCFPAVDTIAAALGCCRRTVQYNMRKLENGGYIIRKDRWYNHQQLSNQYCFAVGIIDDENLVANSSNECKKLCNNFFDQAKDMKKADQIRKVYASGLSAGEKMLLANFCYRANKKGIVYGTISSLKNGIGMRGGRPGCIKDNFYQWIDQLYHKGLIEVKEVYIHKVKYLIIRIKEIIGNIRQEYQEKNKPDGENEKLKQGAENDKKYNLFKKLVKRISNAKVIIHQIGNRLHKILRI